MDAHRVLDLCLSAHAPFSLIDSLTAAMNYNGRPRSRAESRRLQKRALPSQRRFCVTRAKSSQSASAKIRQLA